MDEHKSLAIDPVFADPVYMAVDLCVGLDAEALTSDTTGKTYLEVTMSKNVIRSPDSISRDKAQRRGQEDVVPMSFTKISQPWKFLVQAGQ